MARMTTRRKLAIAAWGSPREPNIYGKMTVDMTAALAYLERASQANGEKITVTHLVGKAVALALERTPTLNGRLVFGRFVPHETVDVTYLVAIEDGEDLAKVKVERANEKNLAQIAGELKVGAAKLRRGEDEAFEKGKGLLRILPTWIIRPMILFSGYLTGALGVDIKSIGLERFPFGSCVITSVARFGVDEGYAPPTSFVRVPLYVLLGAIRDRPAVIDGEVAVRPQLTLTATIDHRFVDGLQAGVLAETVRRVLEDPGSLDDLEADG